MNQKSLFLTIAMLFVAISSWGYSVDEVVYNYANKQNDKTIVYKMVGVKESEGLTCQVICVNSTESSVVVPGEIFTDQNKTVKVISAGWDSRYPISINPSVKTLKLSENITTFSTTFLGCYSKSESVEKLILPASLVEVTSGGDANNKYYSLKEIELASGCTACKVYTTAENSHVLADNGGTNLTLACMRDLNGNMLKSFSVPNGITTGRLFMAQWKFSGDRRKS